MTSELEGIFLWCLEGLHRLISNGYRFTVSRHSAENMEVIRKSNNNILEFLQSAGYIRFKADAQASSKALYEAYKQWCEDNEMCIRDSIYIDLRFAVINDNW